MWNFEDNRSAKGIIIRYTNKLERSLFIFIILWLIFYIFNVGRKRNKNKRWARLEMTQALPNFMPRGSLALPDFPGRFKFRIKNGFQNRR